MRPFLLWIFVAAIFWPGLLLGQPVLGIRGGANIGNIAFERSVPVEGNGIVGIKIGAGLTVPVWGRFGLQFYGDYVSKGTNVSDFDGDFLAKIDYIEFSTMANYRLVSPRRMPSLYVIAGPILAVKVRSDGEERLAEKRWLDSFAFKTMDVGIAGGVGIEKDFNAMPVRGELIGSRSLRAINKTAGVGRMVNFTFSFLIDFGFPI